MICVDGSILGSLNVALLRCMDPRRLSLCLFVTGKNFLGSSEFDCQPPEILWLANLTLFLSFIISVAWFLHY
jgi:hypothetical protein